MISMTIHLSTLLFVVIVLVNKIKTEISFETSMPIVVTKSGKIFGTYEHSASGPVAAFRGIPYALPPVGNLRFKRPFPLKYLRHDIYAMNNAPACAQSNGTFYPWGDSEPGKSEDCLYLNIWAPLPLKRPRFKKLAVIFFIHGGGYYSGSNRLEIYDGRILAGDGNVIVVVINYRLGFLGWSFLNSVKVPGNMGLFDSLEALKWIHRNIHIFGGDNSRITIMGESSGAAMTSLFPLSKLGRPFFRRMIMQSGSVYSQLSPADSRSNYERAVAVAKKVNCTSTQYPWHTNSEKMIECLRSVSAEELISAEGELPGFNRKLFSYRYGDKFLPRHPLILLYKGELKQTELLIGFNQNEGAAALSILNSERLGSFGEKSPNLSKQTWRQILKLNTDYLPHIDELIHYYQAKVDDEDYQGIKSQMTKLIGDLYLTCSSIFFAERMAEQNPVYFYNFVHRPSTSIWAPWMGATHFDEIQFVFGIPLRFPQNYTMEEIKFSRKLIQIWTNFAKTGRPDFPLNKWPMYSRFSPFYVELNATTSKTISYGLHRKDCDFQRLIYNY